MNHMINYNQNLVNSNIDQLPAHITFVEYNTMRRKVKEYWQDRTIKVPNKHHHKKYYKDRDLLFLDLIWETGGRVDDVCRLTVGMIDTTNMILRLYNHKRKKIVTITLGHEIMVFILNYIQNYGIKDRLFTFTRQRAWQLVKKYSQLCHFKDIHPHKFRHGLAIYLQSQGVPTPIISARLGHSNVAITMQNYQKVTPEIQRMILKDIKWRENDEIINI